MSNVLNHLSSPSHRRRGSALMVALALLMMLAVFAALFLTSSRFDKQASSASLDFVRMDLYAEGLAQYVQTCMVAGLWGFDDKPLNYDEDAPPGSPLLNRTPVSAAAAASYAPVRNPPGPDSPYTYFGGRVQVDPDNSTAAPASTANGDEYYHYPNFWLTDPRVQDYVDPNVGGGNRPLFIHPAFVPDRGPLEFTLPITYNAPARVTFPAFYQDYNAAFNATAAPNGWRLPDRNAILWRFADLDRDNRPDTPWLFYKALGNGLYMRAAIRVEDTSSRVNVNVAAQSLPLDASAAADNDWSSPPPVTEGLAFSQVESLLRSTSYKGYPLLSRRGNAIQSLFPILTNGDPSVLQAWEERLGAFLSEQNLLPTAEAWLPTIGQPATAASRLNNGNIGISTWPGRYSSPAGGALPDLAFTFTNRTSVRAPLASLLGEPATGDAGRLGWLLESRLSAAAGNAWDPDPADAAKPRWRTYDPDGLARRLSSPRHQLIGLDERDRPFDVDDTFDLMSLFGRFVPVNAVTSPAHTVPLYGVDEQRYRPTGSLPAASRLEKIWPELLVNNTGNYPVQWRKLLTGYSWTLDVCPYGEDPYAVANPSTASAAGTFRKVHLNTCTGAEFHAALTAANRHSLQNPGAELLTPDQRDRITANFLGYRNKAMNAADLARYLLALYTGPRDTPPVTPSLPPNTAWDNTAWGNWWLTGDTEYTGIRTEADYLTWLFTTKWPTRAAFWTKMNDILAAGVSTIKPADMPTHNSIVGMTRHPYIVELHAEIHNPGNILADDLSDPANPKFNRYAVELYNPWDTALSLEGWYIRTYVAAGMPVEVTLAGVIRPYGRFVVTRWTDPSVYPLLPGWVSDQNDDALVVAGAAVNPVIELLYRPAAGPEAIFDRVTDEWTDGFNSTVVTPVPPPIPYAYNIIRRDDSGFFCYQRWAIQRQATGDPLPGTQTSTLGAPNKWHRPDGTFREDDPWDVTLYGPNPSVLRLGVGEILSLAEVALIPLNVPENGAGTTTLPQAITPFTRAVDAMPDGSIVTGQARFNAMRFAFPMLFHREYTQGVLQPPPATTNLNSIANQTTRGFAGVFQALLDFVTVIDFTRDTVDNNGNGNPDSFAGLDRGEMRIPGRLNVNTLADWFAMDRLSFLTYITGTLGPTSTTPGTADFWRRLFDYRDKRDPEYNSMPWFATSRRAASTGVPTLRDAVNAADAYAFLGFEQLGELCNVQTQVGGLLSSFSGFWQYPMRPGLYGNGDPRNSPMLPQQYMRKFMANVNNLTTRSDTFMVTIRVEIIRPTSTSTADPLTTTGFANYLTGLQRIEVLGQKEYAYLVDRSFCAYPPQQQATTYGYTTGWGLTGTPANPLYNGQFNPNFVAPRVWRMTTPRYAAYGG